MLCVRKEESALRKMGTCHADAGASLRGCCCQALGSSLSTSNESERKEVDGGGRGLREGEGQLVLNGDSFSFTR